MGCFFLYIYDLAPILFLKFLRGGFSVIFSIVNGAKERTTRIFLRADRETKYLPNGAELVSDQGVMLPRPPLPAKRGGHSRSNKAARIIPFFFKDSHAREREGGPKLFFPSCFDNAPSSLLETFGDHHRVFPGTGWK